MEPVFMVLGQSSATAAVLAIEGNTSVQKISYDKLRERLEADKQVLVWTGPRRTGVTGIDPKTLPGLVVDDEAAEKTGTWSSSSSVGGFVGTAYLHDDNAQKGDLTATFRVKVPQPGVYEVRFAYTPNANRATNVPITVEHAGGKAQLTVNERQVPAIERRFHVLGTYRFENQAVITLANANTDGYVVLDAVQLVPRP